MISFDENRLIEFGEVSFDVPIPPVSLQANRSRKAVIKNTIRSLLKSSNYIITGDVSIFIEWYIHEQLRYESDISPDIDNILKPILDALCGPEGLIIDDCQVQAIDCRWIDVTTTLQTINISIKNLNGHYQKKDGLIFLQFENNLCFPLNSNLPDKFIKDFIIYCQDAYQHRDRILEKTRDYYSANCIMPDLRPFHSTRLRNFKIVDIREYF